MQILVHATLLPHGQKALKTCGVENWQDKEY